jgi:hypothetical protein
VLATSDHLLAFEAGQADPPSANRVHRLRAIEGGMSIFIVRPLPVCPGACHLAAVVADGAVVPALDVGHAPAADGVAGKVGEGVDVKIGIGKLA